MKETAWLLSMCLFISIASACGSKESADTGSSNQNKPLAYEVPEQVTWRGELPDILQHERISIETLVQCGLGHTDLKEMPIFGGYPGPEALEMVRRGEAYIGGVGTIENIKVDCLTCGYQYDPRIRAWSKYTSDPAHLHAPLPPAIDTFPVVLAENEERIVSWEQWIQRGELVRTSVQYWSDAFIQDVVNSLNAYLEPHDQHIKVPERGAYDRTLDKYEWSKDELSYELRVLWVYGQDKTHITFIEIKRQTEMTSEERRREHREEVERLMQKEQEKKDSALE